MLLHPTMPLYMVQLFGNLMDNMSQQFNILSWNIRGLNSVARQENLRQMISVHRPELVCIHETKMEIINSITIRNALGPEFEDKFHFFQLLGLVGIFCWLPEGLTFSFRTL
jgi:hypothetical protein